MTKPKETATLPVSPEYVALGDSIAAGAGLASTDSAAGQDELCGRSTSAYPFKVAAQLGTTVRSWACSGATSQNVLNNPQVVSNASITPQLEQAFESGAPDLITLTIGANDIQWVRLINMCYTSTCGSDNDTADQERYRKELQSTLSAIMDTIDKKRAGHTIQVLMSGYYSPFSDLTCVNTDNTVTDTELAWLETQTDELNKTIEEVATAYAFTTYVPVDFSGHGICANEPWIQGSNDAAPFHPTANGQAAIARAFLALIDTDD